MGATQRAMKGWFVGEVFNRETLALSRSVSPFTASFSRGGFGCRVHGLVLQERHSFERLCVVCVCVREREREREKERVCVCESTLRPPLSLRAAREAG
jgi:hypothetical protein